MLQPGQKVAHFEILEPLGSGGMGIVYKARDFQLNRNVALKLLPEAAPNGTRSNLLHEARAASIINHPNIVTIYEAGASGDLSFIAMEFVEGETLASRIPPEGLAIAEAVPIAVAVAEALTAAHAAGIVHRDLKPANVMITHDGKVKVMDFGLAVPIPTPTSGEDETQTVATTERVVSGTLSYMSPEQAEGKPVDARTDIFSFGALFYEMLTGRRAFTGDTFISVISSVLKDTPARVATVRHNVSPKIEAIIERCLQKDRDKRYTSSAELLSSLKALQSQPRNAKPNVGLRVALVVAAFIAAAAALWWGIGQWKQRWIYNVAIPEIQRLRAEEQTFNAFELAMRVHQQAPNDAAVQHALLNCCVQIPFETQPPGATVYYRPYLNPTAPEKLLGTTPSKLFVPLDLLRIRVVKDGYQEFQGSTEPDLVSTIVLDRKGTQPKGMVIVSPATRRVNGQMLALPAFYLDKFEVTNREYKAFVDQGGYTKREYWKHPFRKGGNDLSWDEASKLMVDSTGKPGPATWELGVYPESAADLPVSGVSWYEAAAYAEFAGKSLPAVAHWQRAAGFGYFSDILKLSNFGAQGLVPVGKLQGIGPFGTYDMAGNVKEWCYNSIGESRAALGGSFREASYRFRDLDARDPMERLPVNGFRCARWREPQPPAVFEPMRQAARNPMSETPASDETFRAWTVANGYDPTPLNSKVEATDDHDPIYRKERVSFAAAYGGERVPALLFLPKNARPPFETVVYYPSAEAEFIPSSSGLGNQRYLQFIMRSGRALVYPIYADTYERRPTQAPPGGTNGAFAVRERYKHRLQDMRRAIDYLETRNDIDTKKLAYYGISMGCREGSLMVSMEPRFRTAIFAYCGIPLVRGPEGTDPVDLAPRVKIPTLLLEAREDFTYPYSTSELPLFHLLGAKEPDKKMVLREGGHIVAFPAEIFREILDWFDRYLGPPR